MNRRVLVAVSVLGLTGLACLGACVANNQVVPGEDGGTFDFDGAFPDFDAQALQGLDVHLPGVDAGHDATVPSEDGGEDSGPIIVTGDAGDATVTDAGVDAFVPPVDAGHDAEVDAGFDAGFDAGHDAGFDAGIDASTNCAVDLYADYYVRTDGSLVYFFNPASQTVVMNGVSGQPLATVKSVTAQVDHACALLADATVWCWPTSTGGGNTNGDLGNGTFGGSQTAFTASQVVTNAADAGAPTYLTNVIALDEASMAIYTHPTCAIRSDHTLWCWGYSTGDSSPPAGLYWGTTASESSVPYAFPLASGPAPSDGGAAPLIAADEVSISIDSLCYTSSGATYCLGENVEGNLGTGTAGPFEAYPVPAETTTGLPTNITSLSSAYRLVCARSSGGGVWCWGDNDYEQVGDPGASSPGCGGCIWSPSPVQEALVDGGLTAFPDAGLDQAPFTNVSQIVSGYLESCALDGTGKIWCWGLYSTGNYTEATPFPTGAAPSTGVAKIALSQQQEGAQTAVRYLTSSGVLVQEQTVVTQICP